MTFASRLLALALALACACSARKLAFTCSASEQCTGAVAGTCEPTGFCSFPDASCPAPGRRYGQFADGALAGTCVGGSCGHAGEPCCAQAPECVSPSLTCSSERVCVGCVTQLAAGDAHACALKQSGQVLCWGANDHGQLGTGTTTDAPLPQPVLNAQGMPFDGVVGISAGARHTCIVKADHTLLCFGDSTDGQLGTGSVAAQNPVPMPVSVLVTAFATGARHGCGVDTRMLAWCWGADDVGQITGSTASTMPVAAVTSSSIQLDLVLDFAAGRSHTCARRMAAGGVQLECWGLGTDGQLGTGVLAGSAPPGPVTALGSLVDEARAGGAFTCARSGTQVSCFGADARGQAGQPPTAQVVAPTVVPGLDSVAAIAAGGEHACARRTDGLALCWGGDDHGQLADGASADRAQPASARDADGPLAGVTAIATGATFSCFAVGDGVRCAGANDRGQLGDGTQTEHLLAVAARVTCP